VAALVADGLGLCLDVLIVRKIGVPWQPELALGAVGECGAVVLNDGLVSASGVGPQELAALVRRTAQEVRDVVAQLRPQGVLPDVTGRMAIVVDDGVATGATARAAARVLRQSGAGPVILAAPVAARVTSDSLASSFDEVIAIMTPAQFGSVGQYYEHFEQVSTKAVRQLLEGSSG
jgi:putative phosphoribosyl transferase